MATPLRLSALVAVAIAAMGKPALEALTLAALVMMVSILVIFLTGYLGVVALAGPQAQQVAAKGANTGYKLMVDFISAVTLAPQTVTLSDGKTVSIKLPKGVETGTKIRLAGKGQAGPGGFGDAIVTVTLGKHPHFRKDGDNVLLELPITLKEAVEGGKVRAPTPDGAINLTVKPGMNGGQQLRLKNRGFHTKAGTRGDLIITLRIDIPDNDDALAQFVKDWQPAYDPRSEMQR